MKGVRLSVVIGALAVASAARAGPAHILASRVLAPPPADASYAVSPDLDAATRKALAQALERAGMRTVPADSPHAYLVTVRTGSRVLCTAACSFLLGHDVGTLADFYRHEAVVVAGSDRGSDLSAGSPVSWYTYLQSDGLSNRSEDYLPALLRYGTRAYGRDTAPEAPPKLSRPAPPTSDLKVITGL